jgi:hypothetical protein
VLRKPNAGNNRQSQERLFSSFTESIAASIGPKLALMVGSHGVQLISGVLF